MTYCNVCFDGRLSFLQDGKYKCNCYDTDSHIPMVTFELFQKPFIQEPSTSYSQINSISSQKSLSYVSPNRQYLRKVLTRISKEHSGPCTSRLCKTYVPSKINKIFVTSVHPMKTRHHVCTTGILS